MQTDLWQYLKAAKKPIVLYGMGNGADKIIAVLGQYGIDFHGIFASDAFVRDKVFHGFKITSYADLKAKYGDMIVLMCFGSARPEVIENVLKISAEQEFYAPDVPVYGNTLFNYDYSKENAKRFKAVRARLSDETSIKTFDNIIESKLSGRISPLFECEVDEDEPYKTFFILNDDEIYLDLGAYRGDTVRNFLGRVNGYNKIYAVEPDTKTYSKLCEELKTLKNLITVNACASNACGEVLFNMDGSRGSSLSGKGKYISSISVDSIADHPTFIKMDIEGNEAAAIDGALNTIKTCKPKLQIACYHRSEDLLDIPERVLSIRDDYKVYMRHFSSLPAWDTCYYFV